MHNAKVLEIMSLEKLHGGKKNTWILFERICLEFFHLNKGFLSICVNLKNSFNIPLPTTRPETGSSKALSGCTKI